MQVRLPNPPSDRGSQPDDTGLPPEPVKTFDNTPDLFRDEARKADEDASRRGWSEAQRKEARFVHSLLYSAKSGSPDFRQIRRPYFLPGVPAAALRARDKLAKQIEDAQRKRAIDNESFSEIYAMHLGLEVMIENMELQLAPPRPGGPWVDELCMTCSVRIEHRYRQPGPDPKPVRLRFPKRKREHERKRLVRSAWLAAKNHRLYKRDDFVPLAAGIAEVSEQTILHYLRGIRKSRS